MKVTVVGAGNVGATVANVVALKKFAQEVVLIDIWATWCPPCRAALKDIDAIKPTYQNKGVVFVYLTGETSPQDKWQAMIPSISGDHYRLTKQQ